MNILESEDKSFTQFILQKRGAWFYGLSILLVLLVLVTLVGSIGFEVDPSYIYWNEIPDICIISGFLLIYIGRLILTSRRFEPVIQTSMEFLKEDIPSIIACAGSGTQEAILNRIRIQEVLHPEKDERERMAASLVKSSISDFFELSEDIGISGIDAPGNMMGYSLADLKMRQRYHVNLLTI